jgi:hypothetical protein
VTRSRSRDAAASLSRSRRAGHVSIAGNAHRRGHGAQLPRDRQSARYPRLTHRYRLHRKATLLRRRCGEALTTVERALGSAECGGERWCILDLLCTKGELLLQKKGDQPISTASVGHSIWRETTRCAVLGITKRRESFLALNLRGEATRQSAEARAALCACLGRADTRHFGNRRCDLERPSIAVSAKISASRSRQASSKS